MMGRRRSPAKGEAKRKKRFARRLPGSRILFRHKEAAENQDVHAGAEKGADGIRGRVDNGFTAKVERRVHDDWNAGALAKFVDEPPIERIDFLLDRLWAGATVNVRDGGNDAAFFRTHLRGNNHEGRVKGGFEKIGRGFLFERRREGAPPLAKLHRVVDLNVHFRIAGIGKDGTAAEGARAELHAALEPTEDLALGKELRRGGSRIGEPRRANLVGLESGFDGVVIKRGTEIRVSHGLDGEALATIEVRREGSAEGYAIIGSGGLNE